MIKKKIYIIILIIIMMLLAAFFYFYLEQRVHLLDKEAFNKYNACLSDDAELYKSNTDYSKTIIKLANDNNINAIKDEKGNILISNQTDNGAKNINIISVYNYKVAKSESNTISAMLSLANAKSKHNNFNLIILNDENNSHAGFSYLKNFANAKNDYFFYLYSGNTSSLYKKGFASGTSNINVPIKRVPRKCNTKITININGINTAVVSDDIGKHPNPIISLGAILSKLKSKGYIYQLSDLNIENTGNMYPVGLKATLLVDSFAISDINEYLSKKKDKFIDNYNKDYPNINFSYKITDDASDMPDKAFSDDTTDSLANIIYTIKNGTYKFTNDEEDIEHTKCDIYGINILNGITISKDILQVKIYSLALNDSYLDKITKENQYVAKFANSEFKVVEKLSSWHSDNTDLQKKLSALYSKTSRDASKKLLVNENPIQISTPLSYIADIQKNNVAIISKDKDFKNITNMLLNYIKYY